MWIMRNYDHTEEKALEISAELVKRKNKKVSSAYGAGHLISISNSNLKLKNFTEIDFSEKTLSEVKGLFKEKLKNQIHGLCFSPYVEGQDINDILSESQILTRMNVISPYTKWIRSFSCTEGNELIPEIAHEKGLKSIVGAWISDDEVRNEREIIRFSKRA